MIKAALAALVLSVGFAAPVAAGQIEEAGEAYGRGDFATAFQRLRPLAEHGDAIAQDNLGVMHDAGQGVPQDYTEAAEWYRLAAEQGYAGAKFNLGFMYGDGRGVPQDYVQAHLWFSLAAALGDEEAVKNRDIVQKEMWPWNVWKAERLAREWLEKHPS